jgi:lipase
MDIATPTEATAPQRLMVPVAGGELAVWRWGRGPRVVLAPHGITANHVSWRLIAEQLGTDVTLLAPDLRGRGDSGTLPGPYSMAAHADDLMAVLDHLGIERAMVAGHSMGGFVAVKTALRHPDRVTSLLLIDGGLVLAVPEGLDVDTVLTAVIGPAMERLSLSFASIDAYFDYWRDHPALTADWNELIEEYLTHDVQLVDGAYVSKVNLEAIRGDGGDTLIDHSLRDDLAAIAVPMRFLWAPIGLMGGDPLYPRSVVQAFDDTTPRLDVVELADVNHYTLSLSKAGADQVATQIVRLLDEVGV